MSDYVPSEIIDVNILGLHIRAQTFDTAIHTMLAWLCGSQTHYISTCTVATLMQSRDSKQVHHALTQADMVTADGMPLVWQQKQAGCDFAERVYGPDILHAMCHKTEHLNVRHFFYGGWQDVAPKIQRTLNTQYPDLQVVGTFSPEKINIEHEPQQETIDLINRLDPDIVWVGLGSPKQDLWMQAYQPHLNAKLLIGVGVAFDYLAQTKPQAPLWMQRHGLEWFFRLLTEPRRLWKRYFFYNSRFIVRAILDSPKQITQVKEQNIQT